MLTSKEISEIIGGELKGNPQIELTTIHKIENAKKGAVSFVAREPFLKYLDSTDASAIIIDKSFNFKLRSEEDKAYIVVDNVYYALSKLLKHIEEEKIEKNGISDLSFVSDNAQLSENVSIGAFSYVSDNVKIGSNSAISTQVYIGKNVTIGENVSIYPGVKIYNGCKIGNNCTIHSNTVIGSDGFGFKPNEEGEYKKTPQVGIVVLEDNVEVGANVVIDRATFDETVIRKGVKLDNLIQVAHNVEIGENTVIAAQSGIAGSTTIGKNVIIGGQAGFSGHIKIADGSQFQAQSGVLQSITKENGKYQGSPVIGFMNHMKSSLIFKKLPELQHKINTLEKEIQNLKKLLNDE